MGTPPRSSTRPVQGHVLFSTPVTATAPNAQTPRPLTLNVSGIVAMAKKHVYSGPKVGEKQQEHMDRYDEYNFDVLKTIGYYPGPDAAVVASLAALQHLTGKAKQAVIIWRSKQAPGTLITMEVIFDPLLEDIRLVIPDPMDIAAEVRATTATTVAVEIQKELGQHRRVKISQVMRALNNDIEMGEALDGGAGVMDSYSRCEFWINAFIGARGQPENHWLTRMREQCQWTKNERGIGVQQRDPYLMEEQLANSS
jgi:hypothetical protein